MQVVGFIGSVVQERRTKAQRCFFCFRLAEHFGRAPNRETVWFDVAAFISEQEGDALALGQRVRVEGKLVPSTYLRRDGTSAISLKILAFSVVSLEG